MQLINLLDIDECSEGTDDCHRMSNATCEDTDGSFLCTCIDGFSGNGTVCNGKFVTCVVKLSFTISMQILMSVWTIPFVTSMLNVLINMVALTAFVFLAILAVVSIVLV